MEAMVQGMKENESQDYGSEYQTRLDVKVVKKDGTRESFNAVSYTHLDVYKRQEKHLYGRIPAAIWRGSFFDRLSCLFWTLYRKRIQGKGFGGGSRNIEL